MLSVCPATFGGAHQYIPTQAHGERLKWPYVIRLTVRYIASLMSDLVIFNHMKEYDVHDTLQMSLLRQNQGIVGHH